MAVVYFTSNASTGVGSLSEAIQNARPGDVVRPDEAVFERGATIEIALASTLTIDKNLTLDASPFRVRLDGGGAVRCAHVATDVIATFIGFDFVGGAGFSDSNGGGVICLGRLTLDRCGVYGCSGYYGGGVFAQEALTLNDCVLTGCRASASGGAITTLNGLTLRGTTVVGNVAANSGADVRAEGGDLSASNSIIGKVNATGATSATYSGSVVDVASSNVGFVAPPPDGLTFEGWDANAWQNWDLRLFDDASPNPSPYRDAGDVDNMSRYDVQGNFRGRETGGAASCSPGAYETLQADLFWVGVDASGAPVASPTLLSADGWATSRFASASGDAAPQLGQTLFVDGVVSFSDVLSTTSTQTFGLTLGGGAVVAFEPIQIVYCSMFTLGAGSTFGGLRGRLIGPRQRLRFGANARINTTTLRISINDVWFDAGGYVAACECYAFAPPEPRYGALTLLRATSATTKLSGAYNCESFKTARSGDSASYSLPTAPETSIRCRSFEYKLDFAEGRLFTNAVVVELYGDATATVSRTGTTTLDVAADFAVDATDATSATLTLDGQTVYGDAPNAAVKLTGSAKIDERGLDVASLTLADGAAVVFSGVDAVLSATESATVGAATFSGAGYFATPPETDLTAATFAATIRRVDYSAGVADFTATATGPTTATLVWSATDAAARVCVERENAAAPNGWEVVAVATAAESPLSVALSGSERFRIFDGATFAVDSAWFPTDKFYRYAATVVAVRNVRNDWKIRVKVVMPGSVCYRNEGARFLAQILDGAGTPLAPGDVASITATVYRIGDYLGRTWTPVDGWNAVEVPQTSLLETPTADADWPSNGDDDPGPNFVWTPDVAAKPLFPESGDYATQVKLTLVGGGAVVVTFDSSAR